MVRKRGNCGGDTAGSSDGLGVFEAVGITLTANPNGVIREFSRKKNSCDHVALSAR